MNRHDAEQIAEILDGEVSRDEGCADEEAGWLVLFEQGDGRIVVLSDQAVDEYADREAYRRSCCYATIGFRAGTE